MIFDLPKSPHQRRHGPAGYKDYGSYKPWLRDEFTFRCVFCFFRERWYPDGYAAFSIDHFRPKKLKRKVLNYDNLLYACRSCNCAKRDLLSILDPCVAGYGLHLKVDNDGSVDGLTTEGRILIDSLLLNEPQRVEWRSRMLEVLKRVDLRNAQAFPDLKKWFGFPDDLPELKPLNPRKNSRPNGVQSCYFVKRQAGKLPDYY